MPKYRLLHMNCRTGRRSRQLTKLEYIVWIAYMLSADDFGVCPASARRLQADDPFIASESPKHIQRCLDTIVKVDLLRTFEDGTDVYLYQPDWQDYQRIKHPSKTSLPPIPAELLEKCSPETGALVRNFHPKYAATFPLHARACDANANATANASDLLEGSLRETIAPLDTFEAFWDAYPRKVGKEAARKVWCRLKPPSELVDRIVGALDEQRRSPQWLKDGGQFIPHPATWLNQGRWQDEPMQIAQVSEKTARTMGAIFGTNRESH